VDDFFSGKFPIDIKEIGTTAVEYKEWVDQLLTQKLEKLKCFNKLTKWSLSPLPHHPQLDIRIKKDAHPPKNVRHKVPIHLADELKKFHEDLYARGFIEPDRADVRWSIQSTSRSEYTLIFVISVSCTAVHVLVRLYTVQVYRYRNTGMH